MTQEEKAMAYDEALKRAKEINNEQKAQPFDVMLKVFPELKESEDERIRKAISQCVEDMRGQFEKLYSVHHKDAIAWLEKQSEIDKASYEISEKEKREFVGDGFIKCFADFQDFKEGETYWLEYISNDNYNVRSDNLLGKTCHITPCQLYTIFKKMTWLEKQAQKSFDYESANIQNKDFAPESTPRYSIGDVLCDKSCTTLNKESQPNFEIIDIRNGMYICDKCSFPISQQDEYELVAKRIEQKPYGQREKCSDCQFNYAGECKGTCAMKRDEQKPADKPKFKVGDWILYSGDHYEGVRHITKIDEKGYYIERNGLPHGIIPFNHEICMRLWTIKDAKDGDVLWHSDSASNGIFIFKEIRYDGKVLCYCDYDSEDHFCTGEHHTCCWSNAKYIKPATKEQCDLLFKKMKKAGYRWDAEKKELKKIESNLTEFENTLADICRGWIGEEIGWEDYIIKNSLPLLELAKKQFDKCEQKTAEWSEEDEQYFNFLEKLLEILQIKSTENEIKKGTNSNSEYYYKVIQWLKSLKERLL